MSDPQEPRDRHDPQEGSKLSASPRPGGGSDGGGGGGGCGGLPVAVGWTGASGIAYGVRLVETLLRAGHDVDLTYSANVGLTVPVEMGRPIEAVLEELRAVSAEGSGQAAGGKLKLFARDQYSAPMASGSSGSAGLVIAPCSMGTVGRLVAGTSDSLLLRAADVCLKERRPLIVVPREMPLATSTSSCSASAITSALPWTWSRAGVLARIIHE